MLIRTVPVFYRLGLEASNFRGFKRMHRIELPSYEIGNAKKTVPIQSLPQSHCRALETGDRGYNFFKQLSGFYKHCSDKHFLMPQASSCRYARLDRNAANGHYLSALAIVPQDLLLHMEIAGFYKDISVAGAHAEVAIDQNTVIQRTFHHYKQAHDAGDFI